MSSFSNLNINNSSYNNFLNLTCQTADNMNIASRLTTINEKDLFQNCANLCKEQLECRILQKKLEENPSLASNFIYSKIKDKFYEISLDQFGNYFIQKVIQYLNSEHIEELLYKKIPSHFRCLCFNQHGTRVIQKLFERIVNIEKDLNFYTDLLSLNLKDFIIDQNANHVIIKFINMVPSTKFNFITQYIINNIYELSTKKHSCVIIQKCIEYSDQEQKKILLKAIAVRSYELIGDQYGNYVIQCCINVCDYEINKIIAQNFLLDIPKFSTQKFSSNVIEKCLDYCDEETKELIVQRFCEPILIQNLLFDVYGNYVIQKTMEMAREPLRTKYIQIVGALIDNLQFYPFGQKLYNKLMASFPELSKYSKGGRADIKGNKKKKNKKKKKKFDKDINGNNFNINNMHNINMNVNNFNINNMQNMPNLYNNINNIRNQIYNNNVYLLNNPNPYNNLLYKNMDLQNYAINNINNFNYNNNNNYYYPNITNDNNIDNQYKEKNILQLNNNFLNNKQILSYLNNKQNANANILGMNY